MRTHDRRFFLKAAGLGAAAALLGPPHTRQAQAAAKPNIILCMADDLGWGDTAYNGHPILKTPNLDAMSRSGIRFDRFYAGAPVCSPTRGSAITGRHPYRYGVFFANTGHMRKEEMTLAEALKTQGYATGHFGKWHLGTLTRLEKDANRGGPKNVAHYSPPWENGFDVCFATESKVPTYNPMLNPKSLNDTGPGAPYGTYYWVGEETKATENLEGDDSRIIMDRAVPFIEEKAKAGQPFFTVIWFHAPHLPVVAGPKHRMLYSDLPEAAQHYLGCITALDDQMGRLRKVLRDTGAAGNTMLWFCSDNGPEAKVDKITNGSAGKFRGRKRSLYEGGVRVPGLLEWPDKVKAPRVVDMPCSTLDYFPTVMEALGFTLEGQPGPMDGVSLMPLLDGKMTERPVPIGFESNKQIALNDNRYKLISQDGGETYELYDLIEDKRERFDIAAEHPKIVAKMKTTLEAWRASCKDSLEGKDY